MKTETLQGIGLNDEQIRSVMAEFGNEINPLKQSKATAEQERDSLKTQLDEVNGQLAEAQKKAEKGSDLQNQLKDLQKQFDESKTNADKQLQATKKDYEISAALSQAGAKNAKAVKALLDTEKVNFDDNGKLIGLSEQLEAVKKDNDFLFAETNDGGSGKPNITPAGNPNPNGGNGTKALADYSYQELSALKTDSPSQYQALVGGDK
ncbi:phage scaffolding protein [uncultured Weissella sp.]|uniref:phage scaffolding protein n=1 Tax=uncultured Weissella sp. TaxID=253243 RepID=UPI002585FFE9|nr:phage scaffolding protein [uncultured Weissella sp.]